MAAMPPGLAAVTATLARAGFVAAPDEAAELTARAGGDAGLLGALLRRRLTGEPLAWVTGSTTFCDLAVRVDPGVYVPRWHSEQLARRAVTLLPATGTAVELCTGSGAIARTLMAARPGARVLATDLDERAVACARAGRGIRRVGAPGAGRRGGRASSSQSAPASRHRQALELRRGQAEGDLVVAAQELDEEPLDARRRPGTRRRGRPGARGRGSATAATRRAPWPASRRSASDGPSRPGRWAPCRRGSPSPTAGPTPCRSRRRRRSGSRCARSRSRAPAARRRGRAGRGRACRGAAPTGRRRARRRSRRRTRPGRCRRTGCPAGRRENWSVCWKR